jgi:peptidoglycan/LPS O-acetylase OafA/YrhL
MSAASMHPAAHNATHNHAPHAARNNGLDTLRALAITLVFMYHYMVFVSHEPTFGWLSVVGWVGVDLFFVLSGYLIANQLLRQIMPQGAVSAGAQTNRGLPTDRQLSLTAFYARRALRTWPAFWLVLALYFLLPQLMGGKTPPPLWRFLSFTQNIGLQPGTAFSHAWSLCIEEQFYLLLPLVLLPGLRSGARRGHAWLLLAGLSAIGVGARIWLWQRYGRESGGQIAGFYPNVYYSTLCRFDEFLPGIGVALLKNGYPALWRRIMQHGHALFGGALAASLAMLWGVFNYGYIDGYGYGFFMAAFGYSLLAWAFALLVMAALCPSSPLARLRVPGAYRLALWSYSIYLSHKPLAFMINTFGQQHGWSASLTLICISVASIAVGGLMHYLLEAPFMRLRERHFPDNFVARNTTAAPLHHTKPGAS